MRLVSDSEGNPTEALSWLAFRYISNEMSPLELDAFERRLADDQLAREAVAEAVTWTGTLSSVGPLVSRARRSRWLGKVCGIAAAAAGIAAAALVFHSARNARELETLARTFAAQMGPDTFRVADLDDRTLESEADLTVPSWMIEAVGAQADSEQWEDI